MGVFRNYLLTKLVKRPVVLKNQAYSAVLVSPAYSVAVARCRTAQDLQCLVPDYSVDPTTQDLQCLVPEHSVVPTAQDLQCLVPKHSWFQQLRTLNVWFRSIRWWIWSVQF